MHQTLLAAAVAAVVAVPAAQAAPIAIPFDVTRGGVTYTDIENAAGTNDFTLTPGGVSGPNNAFAITDASTANNPNAYNDAYGIAVNGQFVSTAGATVDVIDGPDGTAVQANPVTPAGMIASHELFFFDNDPIYRVFFLLTNATQSATTATIEIATDLGADADSTLEIDDTGNGLFNAADRYAVFSDGGDDIHPHTLFTLFGEDAPETPTISGLFSNTQGDFENVNTLFELDLAPGETKSLLFFGGVFDTITSSTVEAAAFGATLTRSLAELGADGWLAGLGIEPLSTVVNYAAAASPNPPPIPAPAPLALIALGLAVLGAARRRRG